MNDAHVVAMHCTVKSGEGITYDNTSQSTSCKSEHVAGDVCFDFAISWR
jgi:hypothetical protein